MSEQRTVTISIPPALARAADRLARKEGRTRSELFREAFRQYATRMGRWERIFELGRDVSRRRALTEGDVERLVKEERGARPR